MSYFTSSCYLFVDYYRDIWFYFFLSFGLHILISLSVWSSDFTVYLFLLSYRFYFFYFLLGYNRFLVLYFPLREEIFNRFIDELLIFACMGGSLFFLPIINDNLTRQSILDCRFFPFLSIWNISCHLIISIDYNISAEKSADSFIEVFLYTTLNFFYWPLEFSLNFVILIMMCLLVGLFGFIFLGNFCASYTWISIFFFRFG